MDKLKFQTGAFSDPQGNQTFAAMQWRIAEISDPTAPSFDATQPPKYEIQTTWQSAELPEYHDEFSIPAEVVAAGHAYRVRVRMKDDTGRWSHWSAPQQFVAQPGSPTDVLNGLRVSEVHYNPGPPSPAELAAGYLDKDDFEFIELVNIGAVPIDLRSVGLRADPGCRRRTGS